MLVAAPSTIFAAKPPPTPTPPPPPAPPPIPSPIMVNNQFFDWFTDTNPIPPANYVDSPRLTDANAAAVNTFLQSLGSGIRAVKVESPISNATANLIFNNTSYNVSYIFGDIETGSTQTPIDFGNLVKQVRWVNGVVNGTATRSSKGYVGNYGFSAETSTQEEPASYSSSYKGKHSFAGWTRADYDASGANMSNASLYPGAPDFRNKAAGDSTATNQSPPNIRTSLFMMPLYRMGKGTDSLQATGLYGVHKQVPYIANFNNFGNLALDNGSKATLTPTGVRNAADGYYFKPGVALSGAGGINMTAAQTANQMLSGQDFAALVAHIRLRGADSFHTLESGQIGVSNATMMNQAREGWIGGPGSTPALNNSIDTRMSAADKKLLIGFEQIYGAPASGGTYVQVDGGAVKNPEQTGVILDGVYSLSQAKLNFLVSNMDDVAHTVNLPPTIGGYALNTKDFALGAGTHLLIEYSLTGTGKNIKWTNAVTSIPFTDLDTDRTRPGVPEPGMLSLLGVAGVFGMTRRRRRTASVEL